MSVRYALVISQIQKLTPEKQTMFNNLRDHFIQEQRDADERMREQARIEEEKEKERQEMLSQMSEEKKRLLANITMDMPCEEMPDCEMKYKKIMIEAA
jgi:septal ring factor EnvC (AmiA/AmiB activator)